ncbi:hypothetical protein Flavo103_13140 [Flavobacterium collinsii]|uniref:hypothetical protein n=1 Tax=Flavobacterium collinsii TaxID=1114861 RepID=UPI0022C394AE|nr:hypothetical protein [Flavobacterium collinsii]GIQ58178.1 hypothetical protein Flavo103_13140 [Flavobacterium collinsii]
MDILIVFVSGLVPTLITLWLNERVKGSVQNTFNKQLEEIKKEHSKELSQFQSELNYLKSKESFKFTKLHEKRLEVLERTYYFINETSESLQTYVSPLKSGVKGSTVTEIDKLLSDDFIKTFDEFVVYFKHNSIYFDEEIERLLEKFIKEALLIFATYGKNESAKDNMFSLKELKKNLDPIKKQIEVKFRQLLGE